MALAEPAYCEQHADYGCTRSHDRPGCDRHGDPDCCCDVEPDPEGVTGAD